MFRFTAAGPARQRKGARVRGRAALAACAAALMLAAAGAAPASGAYLYGFRAWDSGHYLNWRMTVCTARRAHLRFLTHIENRYRQINFSGAAWAQPAGCHRQWVTGDDKYPDGSYYGWATVVVNGNAFLHSPYDLFYISG